MDHLDNPAARLHELLTRGKRIVNPSRIPCRQAWKLLLDLDTDATTSDVLGSLGPVFALPQEVRDALESVPRLRSSAYVKRLSKVEAGLASVSLEAPWHDFLQFVTEEVLDELEVCSDTLSRTVPEPSVANDEVLASLLEEVQTLKADVLAAGVSDELEDFLLTSLAEVEAALRTYRYAGSRPLIRAVDATFGAMARRPSATAEMVRTGLRDRVVTLMGRVAVALTIATNTLQLAEASLPSLPEPTQVENPGSQDPGSQVPDDPPHHSPRGRSADAGANDDDSRGNER